VAPAIEFSNPVSDSSLGNRSDINTASMLDGLRWIDGIYSNGVSTEFTVMAFRRNLQHQTGESGVPKGISLDHTHVGIKRAGVGSNTILDR
jgi:hypothetical protein